MSYASNNIWDVLWVPLAFLSWNLQNSKKNIFTWFQSSEAMLTYASKISQLICFLLFHYLPTFLPSWKGYFFIWVICPLARRFWLIKGVGFFTSNPVLHDFFLCLQPSHPLVQTEIKNHKGYGLCDAFPAEFNNHSKTLALLLSTYKSLFSVEITAYYLSHLNNLFHTSEQHNKATHPD